MIFSTSMGQLLLISVFWVTLLDVCFTTSMWIFASGWNYCLIPNFLGWQLFIYVFQADDIWELYHLVLEPVEIKIIFEIHQYLLPAWEQLVKRDAIIFI